jgi:hypothetical protein
MDMIEVILASGDGTPSESEAVAPRRWGPTSGSVVPGIERCSRRTLLEFEVVTAFSGGRVEAPNLDAQISDALRSLLRAEVAGVIWMLL